MSQGETGLLEQLKKAVIDDNPSAVRQSIGQGADMNAPLDKNEGTAVHIAVMVVAHRALGELLKLGAKLELPAADQVTPLHVAAHNGNTQACRMLLEKGVNVNVREYNDYTPLMMAAQEGHFETCEVLIAFKASVNAVTSKNISALHIAAIKGCAVVVRLLMQHGADPKLTTLSLNSTPLHVAATQGNSQVCRIILSFGAADIEARNVHGFTPLLAAAHENKLDTCKTLIESGANVHARSMQEATALQLAASFGYINVVRLLVQSGASVNAVDNARCSPLYMAARNNHCGVVLFLLNNGAEPNAQDMAGTSPLAVAITHDSNLCVQVLAKKSDLLLRVSTGHTALHVAAMQKSSKSLEVLLPLYPDVDVRTAYRERKDWTALMIACSKQRYENASLLCKAGASRTARENRQWTPLHFAALHGDVALLRLLLGSPGRFKIGPDDVNAANILGRTPLHHAANKGSIDACCLLILAGARLDAKTASGDTPIRVAMMRHPDDKDLIALLNGEGGYTVSCATCGVDGPKGLRACTGCNQVMYCSTECQKAGWKDHKADCTRCKEEIEAQAACSVRLWRPGGNGDGRSHS